MHRYCRQVLACLALAAACGCLEEGRSHGPALFPRDDAPPAATYKGLDGQTCAIMVWPDWAVSTDYPQLQMDLARSLHDRLSARFAGKKGAAGATQFMNPASVVRYQREHPEFSALPITEVAPKLGAARVIYVEITAFETHSPTSIMLLRGRAQATLRVVEVAGGKAKVAFEDARIEAYFPPDAPDGVIATDKMHPRTIYAGVLARLADLLAARFAGG